MDSRGSLRADTLAFGLILRSPFLLLGGFLDNETVRFGPGCFLFTSAERLLVAASHGLVQSNDKRKLDKRYAGGVCVILGKNLKERRDGE